MKKSSTNYSESANTQQPNVVLNDSRPPGMEGQILPKKFWTEWLSAHTCELGMCVLLLILFVALFHRVLDFEPGEPEDLRMLSVVATTPNPLKFLIGDWGEAPYTTGDYGMYRPLHPIGLWLAYKVFGVAAWPNQLINLTLHFTNVLIFLMIALRVQNDKVIATVCAALFMVSTYTVSPAIWVTDRASLQVGFALLLLIYHTVKTDEVKAPLRIPYVFILSILALLSKESGLIVPLFALLVSLHRSSTASEKIRQGAAYAAIIGIYMLARFVMFGANALAYTKGGYLFGIIPYETLSDLPVHLRNLSLVDNAVKDVVAVFLPIFSDAGQLEFGLIYALAAVATITLLALSIRKPTILQIYCLVIIILNAAIHFEIFRHRSLYLAQMAFCLFIAARPHFEVERRRWASFATASVVLLLVNIVQVDGDIQAEYQRRYNEVQWRNLDKSLKLYPGRIKPEIARRVLEMYK